MTDKEKLTPQQEHAEPTKDTKEAQAAPDPEQKPAETPADDLLYKQYISKEDIEIDPETGKITEATRERILAALNEHAVDLEKQNGIFAEIEKLAAAGVKKPKNINISKRNESAAEIIARRINAAVKDAATALTNAQKIADLIIKIAGALNVDTARDVLLEMRETFSVLAAMAEEITELEPYLNTELKKLNKPEYKGKTFYQVFYSNDYEAIDIYELYTDPESDLSKILEAARKAKEKATAGGETLPDIHYNKGTTIDTSTTKLSTMFFSAFAPPNKGMLPGQISMGILPDPTEMIPVKYEKTGAKKPITLFYDYTYNEDILQAIGLDKDFDAEDFFLMSICDNLYLEKNTNVSLNKIFREMTGKDGNARDLEKLEGKLKRGASTTMLINDKQLREAWNVNTDKYGELFSPVMPIQIVTERFSVNGNISRGMVKINGLSPLYILSKTIKQITTWDKEILTTYKGRRTPRYWRVLNYLMQQIAWLRNPGSTRSNKITYSDLYNSTGEKTKEGKRAAKNMMFNILDNVFIKLDYIKYYKEDTRGEEGILIKYTPKGKRFYKLPAKK